MAVGVINGGAADDRGSTYNVDAQRLVIDMSNDISLLEPSVAPLLAILSHPDLQKRQAKATRIEWPEMENIPPIAQAALGSTTGSDTATSIPVATGQGAYFRINDLVRNEATGEVLRVDGVTTDTLTVKRGMGASGGTLFVSTSDTLVRLGNAAAQGSTMPTIKMAKMVFNYNYVQTQRDGFGIVGGAQNVQMYGGSYLDVVRKQKNIEHQAAVERSLWFGKRDLRTDPTSSFGSTGRAQLLCGGLIGQFITTNIFDLNGTFALSGANGIDAALRKICRYGSNQRVGFCSPAVFQGFANLSLNSLALSSFKEASSIYGVPAKRYVNGAGDELMLVLKRDWNDYPTTAPGAGGILAILDLDNIKLATVPGRGTRLMENRQLPDEDANKQEWMTDFSLEVSLGGGAATGGVSGGSNVTSGGVHGLVRGITGASYKSGY